MPMKPLRMCRHCGCPNLVESGYCPAHAKQESQRYDKQRGTAASRGYDVQWSKFRTLYMHNHPLCVMCEDKGYIVKADLVHHIIPLDQGGSKYDEINLIGACNDCHENIHGKDRWRKKARNALQLSGDARILALDCGVDIGVIRKG